MFSNAKKVSLFAKLDTNEQRSAFRIGADARRPLELLIGEQRAAIANLSSNGLAFYLGDIIDPSQSPLPKRLDVQIILGATDLPPLDITLEVISQTDGLARCRLAADHAAHRQLCRYIVEHQKQLIKEQQYEPEPSGSKTNSN